MMGSVLIDGVTIFEEMRKILFGWKLVVLFCVSR
jgi:hypothetical protein